MSDVLRYTVCIGLHCITFVLYYCWGTFLLPPVSNTHKDPETPIAIILPIFCPFSSACMHYLP